LKENSKIFCLSLNLSNKNQNIFAKILVSFKNDYFYSAKCIIIIFIILNILLTWKKKKKKKGSFLKYDTTRTL